MKKAFNIITLSAFVALLGVTSVSAHCGSCGAGDTAHQAKNEIAKKGNAPDISHEDLKTAIAEGKVFLIDVNGSQTYKSGHIPGAVDFYEVKEKLAKVLPEDKDALIVAYCGGPSCGAYKKAAKAVASLGYKDVHHYSGGISGWKDAGEQVEKAS